MDINKNTEMPAVKAQPEEDFQDIELPMMDGDINYMPTPEMMGNEDMPDMNNPCWYCPMTNQEQADLDTSMAEEPTPDIPMEDMKMDTELGDSRRMRSYTQDYTDFGYTDYNYRDYNDEDDILEKIERYNPGIFRRLLSYGIPFPAARNIVKRIVRSTVNYYR